MIEYGNLYDRDRLEGEDIAADMAEMAQAAAAAVAVALAQQPPAQAPHDMTPAILSLLDGSVLPFAGNKGEDAPAHFLKFEDHIRELIDLTPVADHPDAPIHVVANQIQRFKKTLIGKARKWFDRIAVPATLVALRDAFFAKYSRDPTRTEDLMIMSQKMKPDDTVAEFGERLSESMARLECPNNMIRDFFLLAMPHEMAMWVRNREPATFEAAFTAAKEWQKLEKIPKSGIASGLGVQFRAQEEDTMQELLDEMKELKAMNILNLKKSRPPSPHPDPPQYRDRARSMSPNQGRVRFEQERDQANQPQYQNRQNWYPNRQNWSSNNRNWSPNGRDWSSNNQNWPQDRQYWQSNRQNQSPNRQNWSQNNWSPNRQNQSPNRQNRGNWQSPNRGRSPDRRDWNPNNQGRWQPPNNQRWSSGTNTGPPNHGRSPERGRSPTGQQNNSQSKQGCWNCGKEGHFFRNCPKSKSEFSFRQKSEQLAMKAFLKDVEGENP